MEKKTCIAIFGLGGVGGYFGARLCELAIKEGNNIRIVFIVTRKTYSEVNKKRKIILDTKQGRVVIDNPDVIHSEETHKLGPVDYVILTTKVYHIPKIVEYIKPLIGRNTLIIPLQNGIDITTYLCNAFGGETNVGCGSCKISCYKIDTGHIKSDSEMGKIYFGEMDNKKSDRILKLLDLFKQCNGVLAEVPEDIHWTLWDKYILIVALSGVGAVTRATIGQWLEIEESNQLFKKSVFEGINVAQSFGIHFKESYGDDLINNIHKISKINPNLTTSMQKDLMSNQQSEMESQIGTMSRLGKKNGVQTPTIDFIYAALKPLSNLTTSKL